MTVVEYKGMYWEQSETVTYPKRVNSTFAIDKLWKLQITNGKATWNIHHNSNMYNPEIVFSVYTPIKPEGETWEEILRKYRKRRAFNNGWIRNEIPLPLNSVTRDHLVEVAGAIDAKLKGL